MMKATISLGLAGLLTTIITAVDAEEEQPQEAEPAAKVFALEPLKPGGLAFDGKLLWITDRVAQSLHGLDPQTGEQRIALSAPGTWPTGLAHDGKLLWVADRKQNRLFGVDTAKRLVMRELESPENPLGLAFDGTYLWVADGKQLHQVSREDGTTIVSFNAPPWNGAGRGSQQLGLAFTRGALWVTDRNQDKIYRVDPTTGDVIDIIPSPGRFPAGLAIRNNALLVVDVDRRQIDRLSIGSLPKVVRHSPRKEVVVFRRRLVNQGPDKLVEAHVYVAIPRSEPGQALAAEPSFSPRPDEIVEDQWGQRFAHFLVRDLGPQEKMELTMTVRATIFGFRYHIDPAAVGSLRDIPAPIRRGYTRDASKFALSHPSIGKHLTEALQGEKRPYWMLRKISHYIQDKMHYEMVGGWNIAPTVIDRGSGSCSEYTFVFIAMCRKAGIPARYAGALVIRGDDASTDEVYHRWAEIYLPGYGWIPWDVQAGDKPEPEKKAAAIGALAPRFLVTTRGGGASKWIGWDYNSTANWVCTGRCQVDDLHLGDWFPGEQAPQEKP